MNYDDPATLVPSVPIGLAAARLGPDEEERQPLLRGLFGVDVVLCVLTVILAGLLASVPVRNSDVWLHLAAGRGLLNGTYHFGADPFSHTTAGAYWVNHEWLYDVATLVLFRVAGGAALVWAKILVVVALAMILIRLGRAGQALWMPAVAATLAVLAIGPRLILSPMIVSYMFLACLLWCLDRPGGEGRPVRLRDAWPIVPLMVLWVNANEWFILGPLLVAAAVLGDAVRTRGRSLTAGVVLLAASLAACLINPHHVHAFRLPSDLTMVFGVENEAFPALRLAPIRLEYYDTALGQHVSGWLVFPIAALGFMSFAVNMRAPGVWRRLPIWLILLALALVQARAVPFFAVAAAPMMARNFQEWSIRRWGDLFITGAALRPAASARVMALLVLAVLPVLAWPGWLQPRPFEPRGWVLEVDPSLRRMAETVAALANGPAGAPRTFNLSPDAAHYLAWFGPGQAGFLDQRPGLYSAAVQADYVAVRDALNSNDAAGARQSVEVLNRHGLTFLILHEREPRRTAAVLRRSPPVLKDWTLTTLDGSVAIYQRADTGSPAHGYEPDRLAFGPAPRTAPGESNAPTAPTPDWKLPFVHTRLRPSPDRDEALLLLAHFDSQVAPRKLASEALWLGAQFVGAGTAPALPELAWRAQLADVRRSLAADGNDRTTPGAIVAIETLAMFTASQNQGPASELLLTIRAARRAIQADPDDETAYLALGDAYSRLGQLTAERAAAAQWFKLNRLRRAQAIGAYTEALRRDPNANAARLALASIYEGMRLSEPALQHLSEYAARARRAGPLRGETGQQFRDRIGGYHTQITGLTEMVARQRDLLASEAATMKIVDRARRALERGLAAQALNILLESDLAAFDAPGLNMEMELLLLLGRANEAREWLQPDHLGMIGELDYRWIRVRAMAVAGDYAAADEELARMVAFTLPARGEVTGDALVRGEMAKVVGQIILNDWRQDRTPVTLMLNVDAQRQLMSHFHRNLALLRQAMELTALRGLLAIEVGDVTRAEAFFRQCVVIWQSDDAVASGAGVEFSGRRLAQLYLEQIDAARTR